ncbi:MAG: PHP domain-containing protein [Candidatus Latescibacteria bacterium]|nr:PHP domain-containing protein [Candidatus Latescibacterota bacterium]
MSRAYYEYKGAIHIHSTYSDGSGEVNEIVEAARNAGLDFIILTDHNTLKAKELGWEGWRNGLLVLVGDEITQRGGHCLALGLDAHVWHLQHHRMIIDEIKVKGGLSFIAHPDGVWRPFFRRHNHRWEDWSFNSFTGLEIWSYMFDWASKFRFYEMWKFWQHPDDSISGPNPALLKHWDRLCRESPVVGIGGVDVHARGLDPYGKVVVFPYTDLFCTIRTHILLTAPFSGHFSTDADAVLGALRAGRCFIGYDLLADTTGFRFHLVDAQAMMGDTILWTPNLTAEVCAPRSGIVTILRDGVPLREIRGTGETFPLDTPGVYRAEVRLHERPWIYSNPIYVRADVSVTTPDFPYREAPP